MSFGKTLRGLREAAGLSQPELAERSGTSINSLRNWEQDRALPRIDAVTRLARALGVSLDRMAYEEERASPGARPRKGKTPAADPPPPRDRPKARKPRGRRGG